MTLPISFPRPWTLGRPCRATDTPSDERAGAPLPAAWVRLLPAALILVDLGLDTTMSSHVAAGFLFIALPGFAAFSMGAGATAAFTVLAILLEMGVAWRVGHQFEQHHVTAYAVTALVGAVSTVLARQRLRQNRDLARARTVAEALQNALLKPLPERLGPLTAAALYRPADADTLISGDLYDVTETPFGYRAIIGDVRGKGLAAVQTVAAVLGTFRETAHEVQDLTELAARLDRRLQRESEADGDGELFVTATLVEYDPGAVAITLLNRGHLDPLLISAEGVRALPTPAELPLGLGNLAGAEADAEPISCPLRPGEVLLLHTDGASEARDDDGVFYPIRERLAERFAGAAAPTPAEAVAHLEQDLAEYTDHTRDDLAVLALAGDMWTKAPVMAGRP